jgi:hypothetical protein
MTSLFLGLYGFQGIHRDQTNPNDARPHLLIAPARGGRLVSEIVEEFAAKWLTHCGRASLTAVAWCP